MRDLPVPVASRTRVDLGEVEEVHEEMEVLEWEEEVKVDGVQWEVEVDVV